MSANLKKISDSIAEAMLNLCIFLLNILC